MTRHTEDMFLQAALDEARLGLAEGGIPIGSVLVIVDDPECVRLMAEFIRTRPELWNEDIGE